MSLTTDVRCRSFSSPPFSEKTNVLLHIRIIFVFVFLLFLPLTSHLLHSSAHVFCFFWHDKRVLRILFHLFFRTSSSNTRKVSGILKLILPDYCFSFSIFFFLPSLLLSCYYNWSRGVFSFCMIQIWWQICFCRAARLPLLFLVSSCFHWYYFLFFHRQDEKTFLPKCPVFSPLFSTPAVWGKEKYQTRHLIYFSTLNPSHLIKSLLHLCIFSVRQRKWDVLFLLVKKDEVHGRDLLLTLSASWLPGQQGFRHRRAGVGENQGLLLVARHRGDVARHRQAAGQPRHEVAAVVWRRKVLWGEEGRENRPREGRLWF